MLSMNYRLPLIIQIVLSPGNTKKNFVLVDHFDLLYTYVFRINFKEVVEVIKFWFVSYIQMFFCIRLLA